MKKYRQIPTTNTDDQKKAPPIARQHRTVPHASLTLAQLKRTYAHKRKLYPATRKPTTSIMRFARASTAGLSQAAQTDRQTKTRAEGSKPTKKRTQTQRRQQTRNALTTWQGARRQ